MPKTSRKISPEISNASTFNHEEQAILRDEYAKISVDDMQKLLKEWELNDHTDIAVDWDLKKRMDDYLEAQNELDIKRQALARRYCKPYEIGFIVEKTRYHLYINKKYVTEINVYKSNEGFYKVVLLCDFRIILMAMHNEVAKWIPASQSSGVDIVAWAVDNGGKCDFNYHSWYTAGCFNITIPV